MPWGSLASAVSSPSFLGAEPFGLTRCPPATLRPEGEAPTAARSGSAQRTEGRQVVATVEVVESCVAPGGQPVLFHAPTEGVPTYVVVDRCGVEHVHTGSLGVAMTAARRVLIEQGEVWVRASDDTCAHIDPNRVATDTPSRPWIQTIAASQQGGTP